jgi:FkbM family methyltransferase
MQTRKTDMGEKPYLVSSDDDYLGGMGNNFELHMVQLIRALVGPKDGVADIGATIGMTALLFADLASKAYAFQLSPATFAIVRKSLTANKAEKVDEFKVWLGPRPNELAITFAQNNCSGGFASRTARADQRHVAETIQIDMLDRFFRNLLPKPMFLKIDVEKFEQQGGRNPGRGVAFARALSFRLTQASMQPLAHLWKAAKPRHWVPKHAPSLSQAWRTNCAGGARVTSSCITVRTRAE